MNSLHPLLLDHAWVAGTGPLKELGATMTTALRLGLPSLVVIGPSGVGKTSACNDLFDALAADTKLVPWRASAVGISNQADTPRFYRSFEGPTGHSPGRLAVLSEQERVLSSIVISCDDAQSQRVVLFIDEAQELVYATLKSLKQLMEQLLAKGIHLLVLLLGEPDLANTSASLMKRAGGGSLVERFFVTTHYLRGLRMEDLSMLMQHVDEARWPENGGPTYTEHFVPTLYRNGWRLVNQAPLLWGAFQREAAGLGLNVVTFEALPRYAVRALRFILSELQQDLHKASNLPKVMEQAVQSCGLAQSCQLRAALAKAEEEAGKGTRRRKKL